MSVNSGNLSVGSFLKKHENKLSLLMHGGENGLSRSLGSFQIVRTSLALKGFFDEVTSTSILVFGIPELSYLKSLNKSEASESLRPIFYRQVPLVVVTGNLTPTFEMVKLSNEFGVPLLSSAMPAIELERELYDLIFEEFTPKSSCHGTLTEVFGVGLLLQGNSAVGKSETALGLIERGHRLVSDDVVILKKIDDFVVGSGPDLTRHMLEIRGIGLINIAHLYGTVCISEECRIDLIVQLEEWSKERFYDRVGLDDRYEELVGTKIAFNTIPVRPGRDLVLLLEAMVLNHRLKRLGYNCAREFSDKLLKVISDKRKALFT